MSKTISLFFPKNQYILCGEQYRPMRMCGLEQSPLKPRNHSSFPLLLCGEHIIVLLKASGFLVMLLHYI